MLTDVSRVEGYGLCSGKRLEAHLKPQLALPYGVTAASQ
jgi:hypothetical protein